MAQLKGGFVTSDPRLDWIPAHDEASRGFMARSLIVGNAPVIEKAPRSFTWSVPYWLNQGQEGRCVEYSICHDLLARPVMVDPRFVTDILAGKKIYWPSQRDDYWQGGSYPGAVPFSEGTSVLHGIKTTAALGFFGEYRWSFTLQEAILSLGYVGPLILGMNWHPGMFNTDSNGFIHPTGPVAGGHAILAHSVKIVWLDPRGPKVWANVDLVRSYIILHNSWGQGWGINGRAKLNLIDFDALRRANSEVCVIPSGSRARTVQFPVRDLMLAA